MKNFKHQNVVEVFDIDMPHDIERSAGQISIFMEYFERGSLADDIMQRRRTSLVGYLFHNYNLLIISLDLHMFYEMHFRFSFKWLRACCSSTQEESCFLTITCVDLANGILSTHQQVTDLYCIEISSQETVMIIEEN